MITGRVAGHQFVNGACVGNKTIADSSATSGTMQLVDCQRRWADIQHYTHLNVGQKDIAHTGELTLAEASEIVAAKIKQDYAVAISMGWQDADAIARS